MAGFSMEKSELLLYNNKMRNSFNKSGTRAKWFFMTNSGVSHATQRFS
ncbi:hypothetical protein CSB67_2751 [Enterobacter hormaechei]|nr:hypothetical protein CSB67_2751 [Enterobacter hormaechei]